MGLSRDVTSRSVCGRGSRFVQKWRTAIALAALFATGSATAQDATGLDFLLEPAVRTMAEDIQDGDAPAPPPQIEPTGFIGGTEFRINSTLQGSQDDVRAVPLAGGGFVAVWMDRSQAAPDTSGWGVRARIFENAGVPLAADFSVNGIPGPDVGGDQVSPEPAPLADGGFVVVWRSVPCSCLRGRIFDAAGAATSAIFAISDSPVHYDAPRVDTLDTGDFVVVWTTQSASDGSGSAIRGRRFAPDGTPRAASAILNSVTTGNQYVPDIAALTGGGYVVAWKAGPIWARIFSSTGVAAGPDQILNPPPNLPVDTSNRPLEIDALTTGGFVVAWDNGNVGRYRRFDASGNAVGPAAITAPSINSGTSFTQVTGLAGGGAAVVWRADHYIPQIPSYPYSPAEVGGRIIGADGVAVGSVFLVNQITSGQQTSRSVNRLGTGFLSAWTTPSGDLAGRIFLPENTYTLTINFPGTRPGRVHDLANGIDCSTDCTIQVAAGTALTLTRQPLVSNSKFTGWQDACTGLGETCSLTMDQNRTVDARFFPGVRFTGPVGTPTYAPSDTIAVSWEGGDPDLQLRFGLVDYTTWTNHGSFPPIPNTGTTLVDLSARTFNCTHVYGFYIESLPRYIYWSYGGQFRIACPPVATNDFADLGEDDGVTDLTAALLGNDTGSGPAITAVNAGGASGLVALAGGSVTYSPNGAFESLAAGEQAFDAFTYTIADTAGQSATATVVVTITGANDAPTASNDGVDVNRDDAATDLTALLLQFDTDPDTSDALSVSAIDTTGTIGQVTLVSGVVSYDPNGAFDTLTAGQSATDSFTYMISDGNGGSDTGTVTITVHGTNTPPDPNDDNLGVGANPFTAEADFQVNQTTTNLQMFPDIFTLTNGNFVVVWLDIHDAGPIFNKGQVRYRIYSPQGVALTDELDTADTSETVSSPHAAALPNGGFVIAWNQAGGTPHDNIGYGVLARVFDNGGARVSGLIPVNAWVINDQTEPDVAALADGGFVVSWTDRSIESPDASSGSIGARRFTADGTPATATEFQVNIFEPGHQNASSVVGLADGGYAIAWQSDDGSDVLSRYRIFEANDTPRTTELGFDTDTDASPGRPHLAPHSSGGFMMTPAIGTTASVTRAAIYSAAGVPTGDAILTEPGATGHGSAAVIELAGGEIGLTWSNWQTTDIEHQLFDTAFAPSTQIATVNTSLPDRQENPAITALHHGGYAIAWTDFGAPAPDSDESSVRARVYVPPLTCPANASFGITGSPDFLVNQYTDYHQAYPRVATLDSGFVVVWEDYVSTDGAVSPREIIRGRRYQNDGTPIGNEFVVNTLTDAAQFQPDVVGLPGGGFVVVWFDEGNRADDPEGHAIRGRIFDAAGTGQGGDFLINTTVAGRQQYPAVDRLTGGRFVVSWADGSQLDGVNDVVRYRVFEANGTPASTELQANETAAGAHWRRLFSTRSGVTAMADGGFVISWSGEHSAGGDTSGLSARARRFDADGVAQSGEFLINQTTANEQWAPHGAAFGNGVAFTWIDETPVPGWQAQVRFRHDPNGATQLGNEISVAGSGNGSYPRLAPFGDDGVLATYLRGNIAASLMRPDGTVVSSPTTVSTSPGNVFGHDVAALPDGHFVAVWTLSLAAGMDVRARVFQGECTTPDMLVAETSGPRAITVNLANVTHRLDVLANDTDSDGDLISIARINGLAISEGGTIALPSGGRVMLDGGELVYDPRTAPFAIALADGAVRDDRFTYTVTDGRGGFATAAVTIWITGVNDAPTALEAQFHVNEDGGAADLTATLVAYGSDPDHDTLQVMDIDSSGTVGTVTTTALSASAAWRSPIPATAAGLSVSYNPAGNFQGLGTGEVFSDSLTYTLADPSGETASAIARVIVFGSNDAPTASDDALAFAASEAAADITGLLLINDTDPDDNDLLAVSAIDTTGTAGLAVLADGVVTYDPNRAFDGLAGGASATDSFGYTISDPSGVTSSATVTVTVTAISIADYQLTVSVEGLGTGSVASTPDGIACGNGGLACTSEHTNGIMVSLDAVAAEGSHFDGWSGDCRGETETRCRLSMTQARSAGARFALDTVPAGRVVAATLPGARSGFIGGPPLTVFASVVSRQSTPAQTCTIGTPDDSGILLSYRRVNGSNEPVGEINPVFDLAQGGVASFILQLTPGTPTDATGELFFPRIVCENAEVDPVEGVNSVFLTVGYEDAPDILSIAATPSGDGVIRIASVGGANVMSAAAVNIGAGDGTAGAGEATVTVSTDTGDAALPVTLSLCETGTDGICLAPRTGVTSLQTVFGNDAKFFAVFARAAGDQGIAFSPANARVFLRFADGNGVTRSVTSAAITAPAPDADRPETAVPVGRWSVLVRQGPADWPSLRRASLYVLDDGTALLDDGESITRMDLSPHESGYGESPQFTVGTLPGSWTPGLAIQVGDAARPSNNALWGIFDARSDRPVNWPDVAGRYGEGLTVTRDGRILGSLDGCLVAGDAVAASSDAPGVLGARLELMGCGAAGDYIATINGVANDNERPALLIAGARTGWRLERQ